MAAWQYGINEYVFMHAVLSIWLKVGTPLERSNIWKKY